MYDIGYFLSTSFVFTCLCLDSVGRSGFSTIWSVCADISGEFTVIPPHRQHHLNLTNLLSFLVQREPEKACVNDVTGVGNIRQSVYIAGLTLALFTLLPIWDQLADELGIGLGLPF